MIIDCSFSPKASNKDEKRIAELEQKLQLSLEENDTISLRLPVQALDLVKPALLDALKRATIKHAREAQHRNEKPIPKTQGQAGRGSGYTLHLAMGIEYDHFLRIQVSSKLLYI